MQTFKNKEILEWTLVCPDTNQKIVYTSTNEFVKIKDMIREEEKKLRIIRLKSKKKALAFNQETFLLLHQDRKNGMSIRNLARKYDKSTRTIQKYLKMNGIGED